LADLIGTVLNHTCKAQTFHLPVIVTASERKQESELLFYWTRLNTLNHTTVYKHSLERT